MDQLPHLNSMGCRDKQKAAAHATAARLHALNLAHHNISALEADTCPINISSDSNSDCGYKGGVNFSLSKSDSFDYLDAESLEELEGEELEANLNELRAELKELPTCMKYDMLMELKTVKDWKKAEENHTLGYTGNLKCTQERQAKDLHDRKTSRAKAQTS